MLRVTWLGTYVQTQHDDHDDVVGQGDIHIVHDQDLMVSEARLGLEAGLTRRFAASLMLPVRVLGSSIRYLDMAGAEVQLVQPSIHHRDETLVGVADPMVLGAASGTLGAWRVTGRAGATIPLGRTEDDPFALGELGRAHQHIQMGTGTFNPVLAVEVARAWGGWRVGGFGFTQQVVYQNARGFHAGDRYAGGIAARRRLSDRWNLRGSVEVQAETAERWRGIQHTDDGNRGRFDLIVGAGASWAATAQTTLDVALKLPAITHAVGGQLDMPAIVEIGASWTLGGPPPKPRAPEAPGTHDHADGGGHSHEAEGEHRHAHDEHGDGAQDHGGPAPDAPDAPDAPARAAAGLDVIDLGRPGEAVELVPVRGKVTIFDFWATWCEPCKLLEPALVDLARAHPDLVAIRRIDTVDWDSAVVAQHLTPRGFSLPHLKVFDATGRLVLERSSERGALDGRGTPTGSAEWRRGAIEALIRDVRAVVEAEAAKRGTGKPRS